MYVLKFIGFLVSVTLHTLQALGVQDVKGAISIGSAYRCMGIMDRNIVISFNDCARSADPIKESNLGVACYVYYPVVGGKLA